MSITPKEIETVQEIMLNGARRHFPPSVQFHDAIVTVKLDAQDEEFLNIHLIYSAPSRVLDGYLMMTFFRVTDEPLRKAGITAHALVMYADINDPTLPEHLKPTITPTPTPAS